MTGRYVYYTIRFTVANSQSCILKKTDLLRFFIRHSVELEENQMWVEKNSNGSLGPSLFSQQLIHDVISQGSPNYATRSRFVINEK